MDVKGPAHIEKRQQRFSIGYAIAAIVALVVIQSLFLGPHTENLSYRDLKRLVAKGKVTDVLEGWWREGCVEGVTGWSIGAADPVGGDDASRADADDLYRKLQRVIAPSFYEDREAWVRVMRQCIALNGSFFNTHRMVRQYTLHAYSLGEGRSA